MNKFAVFLLFLFCMKHCYSVDLSITQLNQG